MGIDAVRDELLTLFQTLDARIEEIDRKRRRGGLPHTPKAKVRLLGQIALLVDERVHRSRVRFGQQGHQGSGKEQASHPPGINRYHVAVFVGLLERLRKINDGDGTLLDHSMVLYGSAMGDGNQHNHDPLPVILAGGASGKLKGGRHIRNPKNTTMSNLLLAMLDKLGIRQETFGDSTGVMAI